MGARRSSQRRSHLKTALNEGVQLRRRGGRERRRGRQRTTQVPVQVSQCAMTEDVAHEVPGVARGKRGGVAESRTRDASSSGAALHAPGAEVGLCDRVAREE